MTTVATWTTKDSSADDGLIIWRMHKVGCGTLLTLPRALLSRQACRLPWEDAWRLVTAAAAGSAHRRPAVRRLPTGMACCVRPTWDNTRVPCTTKRPDRVTSEAQAMCTLYARLIEQLELSDTHLFHSTLRTPLKTQAAHIRRWEKLCLENEEKWGKDASAHFV